MDLNGFLTPQGFSSLLGQLVSAENEQRKQAEAVFDQVKQQQPEACAGNLLAALRSAPEVEHRSFAAIMMRKVGEGDGRGEVLRTGVRMKWCLWAWGWGNASAKAKALDSQKSTPPLNPQLLCWLPVAVQVLVTDHQNIWGSISPSMQDHLVEKERALPIPYTLMCCGHLCAPISTCIGCTTSARESKHARDKGGGFAQWCSFVMPAAAS
eukprot:1159036-Pelagomonas_calceolata.AAC.8